MLDEIQKKTNFIKLGNENTNDFVKEYYMSLRSNVQLTTEEAIQKIKEISIKLIKGIDDHEQETLEFNTLTKSFDDSKQIIKELELFYTKFSVYLTKNEFDNNVVKKSNEEAINLMNLCMLNMMDHTVDNYKKHCNNHYYNSMNKFLG